MTSSVRILLLKLLKIWKIFLSLSLVKKFGSGSASKCSGSATLLLSADLLVLVGGGPAVLQPSNQGTSCILQPTTTIQLFFLNIVFVYYFFTVPGAWRFSLPSREVLTLHSEHSIWPGGWSRTFCPIVGRN